MLIVTDFTESERDRSSQLLNISCYSEMKNEKGKVQKKRNCMTLSDRGSEEQDHNRSPYFVADCPYFVAVMILRKTERRTINNCANLIYYY